jgi:hypothetical protein
MDTEDSFPCSHQPVTGTGVSLVHILLYNTSVADAFCTSCSVFQVSSGVLRALKPTGHYMYRQFNTQQFYVLPTQCIYVFCVDLRTKRLFLVCIIETKTVFAARLIK